MLGLALQLKEATNDQERDQIKKRLNQQYNLTEDDWELIKCIVVNRQYSVLRYNHNMDDSYIGDFAPIVVMQEDRKQEVQDDYKAVM